MEVGFFQVVAMVGEPEVRTRWSALIPRVFSVGLWQLSSVRFLSKSEDICEEFTLTVEARHEPGCVSIRYPTISYMTALASE